MKYLNTKELAILAVIAVVNSVLEISLGSLMHAFKIPNAGVFMIMVNLSLYLLAKGIVPKKGIVIIIGFITAFIKLVYGGELSRLGPAFAILMEAGIIEVILCFLPVKLYTALICGGFTNVFVLFYPLISYTLFGGGTGIANLNRVFSAMPSYLVKLGLPIAIVVYFFLGVAIGSISWNISQRLLSLYSGNKEFNKTACY